MTDHRPRCEVHHHRRPCPMCAADHAAGEHAYPRPECPRCTTPAPTPDAARAAAHDTDLEDS